MKRSICALIFCIIVIGVLLPVKVNGDMGPKPTTVITFENMGDEVCYGTLLSKDESNGPWPSYALEYDEDYSEIDYEIWEAFINYKDIDNFNYWKEPELCSETKSIDWVYYPPETFKILLYYPETKTFVESEICRRYAFHSYYTVDMEGIKVKDVERGEQLLTVDQEYNYWISIFGLLCRITFTILIEIGIAFFFGFNQKKLLSWIIGINVFTQVILNVSLNILSYCNNYANIGFYFYYALFEIIVFLIEAIVYSCLFNRVSEKRISIIKATAYALIANIFSFFTGVFIALLFPDTTIF